MTDDRSDIIGFRDGSPIRRHPEHTAENDAPVHGLSDGYRDGRELQRARCGDWRKGDRFSGDESLVTCPACRVIPPGSGEAK
jgi:hypothetical protein